MPFEKTIELVNGLFKPGIAFFKTRPGANNALRVAALEEMVGRLEDVAAAMVDPNLKVALFEFGLTPQMFYAFDCAPLCLETYPSVFTSNKKEVVYEFITAAEEAGAPSDVCSTDRFILGAALCGEMPDNSFFVTSSSPCDGTRIAYPIMKKILEIPIQYIEAPYT